MSKSQKFLSRNRAPRVQIEYDVELYGAQKKVQLPFVMGVFSDLSGTSEKPDVASRAFLEIDTDNFDDRMRGIAPRAQFTVPNTLTGEGALAIDLSFERMEDFSPQAIARKVDALKPLFEARQQLSDLMAYMDGKSGAETLIEKLLNSPALLAALAGGAQGDAGPDADAALAALKAQMPQTADEDDSRDDTLAALAADAPTDDAPGDDHAAALDALRAAPVAEPREDTSADVILAGIDRTAEDAAPADDKAGVLDALRSAAPDTPEQEDRTHKILSGLEAVAPNEADRVDLEAVLDGIEAAPETEVGDDTDTILSSLDAPPEAEVGPDVDEVLGTIQATDEPSAEDDTDDILSGLDTACEDEDDGDDTDDVLSSVPRAASDDPDRVDLGAVLGSIQRVTAETPDTTDDNLADLEPVEEDTPADTDLDDVLAELGESDETTEADTDLDDLMADLDIGGEDAAEQGETEDTDTNLDLDDLMADLDTDDEDKEDAAGEEETDADFDAPMADLNAGDEDTDLDFDALMADLDSGDEVANDTTDEDETEDTDLDLDDLMADLDIGDGDTEDTTDEDETEGPDTDLDALMADLDTGDEDTDDGTGEDEDTDLDDLMAGLDADDADGEDASEPEPEPEPETEQSPFGVISAPRPDRASLPRKKFRIAIFGDFTARAARGLREVGDALAARRPIALDVDTIEDVIESFATTLTLPIGKDGSGIEVRLTSLDDLHPDELFDNVELFAALGALKQQLGVSSMADKARAQLKAWSQDYGKQVRLPKRSAATSVPAHLKLSEFQALIGDTSGHLTKAGPIDDMIARIVGPHVVRNPDSDARAMMGAVDEALGSAMRLILHHPHFQAVEAQWRSLDLLARRIETDSNLEIVLYDVSAEELAIDLAQYEDLAQSGLFRLLTDVLDPEQGAGGFSAVFGLYTFEETPPHAELLARIGQVAGHVDAAFFAGITPSYLTIAKEDRHPLVADTWDTLRRMPEAHYLGLASPRFLLRQPYGAKSDPVYAFDFEEFTPREGLSGMLWANPVILIAILLAGTYVKDGKALQLGSLMSLGDMPFFYVMDRYGDQVALPCTERNLTSDPVQHTLARGFMPVLWMKGRNEIRLGSFRSLAGVDICGPWTGQVPTGKPGGKGPSFEMSFKSGLPAAAGKAAPGPAKGGDDDGLDGFGTGDDDDLLSGSDDGDDLLGGFDLEDFGSDSSDGDSDSDLDDFLSGFNDDDSEAEDDDNSDEMDDDLKSLLDGL